MRRGWSLFVGVLLSLSLGLGLASCTPELLARRSTRGAVHGTAEGLGGLDPELLSRLRALYLNDDTIRRLTRDLTSGIVLGSVDGLRKAQVDQLAAQAASATMAALKGQGGAALRGLADEAGPVLEAALRRGVSEAILSAGAALRQSAQRDLSVATQVLVRAAVGATVDTLRQRLGGVGVDLGARTERYLDESLTPAAGRMARVMMREAMAGAAEGIRDASQGPDLPLRAVMREIGMGLAEGMSSGVTQKSNLPELLIAGVVVLSALLIGSLVAAFFLWRRYQRTTRSLVLFAQQMNDTRRSDDAAIRGLRDSILAAQVDPRQAAWLNRFFERRGLSSFVQPASSPGVAAPRGPDKAPGAPTRAPDPAGVPPEVPAGTSGGALTRS